MDINNANIIGLFGLRKSPTIMANFMLACLLCLTATLAFPIEEFKDINKRRTTRDVPDDGGPRKIRLFGSNRHSYRASVSASENHSSPKSWWVGGDAAYKHIPTGSQFSINKNRTLTTTDLEAKGNINFNNHHSLFGSFDSQDRPGFRSRGGKIGYAHKPTDTELSFGALRNPTGTDLILDGKTDFRAGDDHHFKGLFHGRKGTGENPSSLNAMIDYNHAPTGNQLTFGTALANNDLSLNGGGKVNLDRNHAFTGSVRSRQNKGLWTNEGDVTYRHKPSNSDLTFGFQNKPTGNELSLKGQTQLENHRFSGSSIFSHDNEGRSIGGTLGYNHKPSNSDLTFGFKNNPTGTDLSLKGNTILANNHQLSGSGSFNQKFGQPPSIDASLDYSHKPSNSAVNFGFQNGISGTDLSLNGQTGNDKHGFSGSSVFSHKPGEQPRLNAAVDYIHKPSNSKFGVGFENGVDGHAVNLNGDFNFGKNGKLGVGSRFANGPGSSSTGFEISGAF